MVWATIGAHNRDMAASLPVARSVEERKPIFIPITIPHFAWFTGLENPEVVEVHDSLRTGGAAQ
jgi:hypothetical protein